MKKLILTTKIFNSLHREAEYSFQEIERNIKENENLSSCISHTGIISNAIELILLFTLHKRSFRVIPKYDFYNKSVNLQTFEIVDDHNNIGHNKLVNVWGTDYIIKLDELKENTIADTTGEAFFKVVIEGLYPDKK